MGEERKVYKVLVGESEGKRPLGSPRRRWEDGIRMDLRKFGLGVWIGIECLLRETGSINQLISVMVKCCVLFEVRTGFLNNI
jgi:hypothetical protein